MLSRTADALFWLGRYTERAGNVARGLQGALRMGGLAGPDDEWRSLLIVVGAEDRFDEGHAAATPEAVADYLIRDRSLPSSIVSCLEAARGNARAVRSAITTDMWEAINDTWIELRRMPPEAMRGDALPGFLDWVRARTLLFNGAAADTMLRDEAWRFVHLGTMLSRADNTARLLDVKHHVLAPEADGAVDYVQWQAVLRSVSALRAYQHLYRARLQPRLIAEMMILRPELPRSLLACYARVEETLEAIADGQGGRRGECHRLAGELHARLRYTRIDALLAGGLHAFLTDAIDRHIDLGREIAAFYLAG